MPAESTDLIRKGESLIRAARRNAIDAALAVVAQWLRTDEAARITAGAGGDPWYAAGKLADRLEADDAV